MTALDTHAWIWHATAPEKLSARARGAISKADQLGVSAISLWEIAMLVQHGRLKFDRPLAHWFEAALSLPRIELLPITPEIAIGSTTLRAAFHADPADRIIAATAIAHRAVLVTKDDQIRKSGDVEAIW